MPAWTWSYPYGSVCGVESDNSEQLAKQPYGSNQSIHGCSASSTKLATTPYVLANDFHIYSAAVYPDHVDFYIDGVKYNSTYNSEVSNQWVGGTTKNSFLIDLDVGSCGSWADCPSASGPGTADMLVDWYHVYSL